MAALRSLMSHKNFADMSVRFGELSRSPRTKDSGFNECFENAECYLC